MSDKFDIMEFLEQKNAESRAKTDKEGADFLKDLEARLAKGNAAREAQIAASAVRKAEINARFAKESAENKTALLATLDKFDKEEKLLLEMGKRRK